jgi:transposase
MKLFVAAMGASNYTYAEACPSESLSDWIGVHASLFRYLGGVPKFVVCDNLKAAVTNPDRYDPGINRTYAEMAGHYGTAILAARPRRPKDKAKVEVAVQIAQRWVLARLRNQRFFSFAELIPPSAGSSSNSTPARCAASARAGPNCSPRLIAPS